MPPLTLQRQCLYHVTYDCSLHISLSICPLLSEKSKQYSRKTVRSKLTGTRRLGLFFSGLPTSEWGGLLERGAEAYTVAPTNSCVIIMRANYGRLPALRMPINSDVIIARELFHWATVHLQLHQHVSLFIKRFRGFSRVRVNRILTRTRLARIELVTALCT